MPVVELPHSELKINRLMMMAPHHKTKGVVFFQTFTLEDRLKEMTPNSAGY
jgi:hypothetical protein